MLISTTADPQLTKTEANILQTKYYKYTCQVYNSYQNQVTIAFFKHDPITITEILKRNFQMFYHDYCYRRKSSIDVCKVFA